MKKVFFLLIVIFMANFCFAQEKKDETTIIPAESWACEGNPAAISGVVTKAKLEKERVFVIFRAGKTETETVNRKRLAYVKRNSLEGRAKYHKLEFIYALGEKSDKEGRIEFYIGGRLSLIIIAPKNKTPCLNCCGVERESPQNLLRKKKKRKIKIYKN